jgi:hypothetical protein
LVSKRCIWLVQVSPLAKTPCINTTGGVLLLQGVGVGMGAVSQSGFAVFFRQDWVLISTVNIKNELRSKERIFGVYF